jgi:hypothetical protein
MCLNMFVLNLGKWEDNLCKIIWSTRYIFVKL